MTKSTKEKCSTCNRKVVPKVEEFEVQGGCKQTVLGRQIEHPVCIESWRCPNCGNANFECLGSSPESVGETSWEMDFLRHGRAKECWGLVEEGLGRCGPKPGENILPP